MHYGQIALFSHFTSFSHRLVSPGSCLPSHGFVAPRFNSSPGFVALGPPPSRSRSDFLPACSRSPRSSLPPGLFCPARQTGRPCPAAGQLTGHCQPHLAEMQKCRKLEMQKYRAPVCWPGLCVPPSLPDSWVGQNCMKLHSSNHL